MSKQADRRAHFDLQITLLAEQEMTLVLKMLGELCEKHGVEVPMDPPQIEKLRGDMNVFGMVRSRTSDRGGESAGRKERQTPLPAWRHCSATAPPEIPAACTQTQPGGFPAELKPRGRTRLS